MDDYNTDYYSDYYSTTSSPTVDIIPDNQNALTAPTNTTSEKSSQKSSKQKPASKTPFIIIGVITAIIVVVWIGIVIWAAVTKKWFFAYQRPTTLPNQTGPTINPTPTGYPLPLGTLKGRTILLGGDLKPVTDQDARNKQIQDQITAWNDYQKNPNTATSNGMLKNIITY